MSVKLTDQEVKILQEDVRDDSKELNWYLVNQVEQEQVKILASGTGGYNEFISHLDDAEVQFGLFRVNAIVTEAEETKRVKFVGVIWIGPGVKSIKRGKVSVLVSTVEKFLNAHLVIKAESRDDLARDIIEKKLTANAGAHSPSSYEF